jgi:RNA polymerase sigma factor for flagellar operon FliA
VPAETNSLTEQQQADPPVSVVSPKADNKNACGERGRTAKGHLKAARRAYAGQKKKPLDEQQIAQFLPLVHKIVQRAAGYLRPPLTYDDLVSAGTVGLVKAARDYDPSFNAEFKTYAYIRIKGAILDELRGWAFIPPNVNKQIRRAMDLSIEITKQTGTAPSETELAEKLGLTLDEVYQTFDNARAQQFLSIDGSGSDTPALANILAEPDAQTPDWQFEQAELLERLSKTIQELDERQRQIILLYYQQHLTMKQIAEVFSVTEPRVSQLHAAALFTLSAKLRYLCDAGQ